MWLQAPEVEAVRACAPEGGLRTLLSGAVEVPVADPCVALDFDTPAAWEKFRGLWRQRA